LAHAWLAASANCAATRPTTIITRRFIRYPLPVGATLHRVLTISQLFC
jgi:hypothetical protein